MGNNGPQMPGSPGSNMLPSNIVPSLSEFSDDALSLGPHHSLAGKSHKWSSNFLSEYLTNRDLALTDLFLEFKETICRSCTLHSHL